MNLNDLKKELPYKWRVQSTKYGKTTCVAYIDARDCQDLLDEVCGPENWQSMYQMHLNVHVYHGVQVGSYIDYQYKL